MSSGVLGLFKFGKQGHIEEFCRLGRLFMRPLAEPDAKRTRIRVKADSDSSESGHFDGLVVMVSAFVGQVSVFVGIEFSHGYEVS